MNKKCILALPCVLVLLAFGACSKPEAPPSKEGGANVKSKTTQPAPAKTLPAKQDTTKTAKAAQAKRPRKLKRAGSGPPAKEVKWSDSIACVDYKEGLAQALKERKPVLLLVYTNW